jgi:hypothetical protein
MPPVVFCGRPRAVENAIQVSLSNPRMIKPNKISLQAGAGGLRIAPVIEISP